MNAVEIVRQALLAELAPLDQEAKELHTRLAHLQTTKAKLAAALAELAPEKKRKTKAKGNAPTRQTEVGNYAHKPDIEAVCTPLWEDNPKITAQELREMAEEKLVNELQFVRSGIGMGINRWLDAHGFDSKDAESTSLPTSQKLGPQMTRTASLGESHLSVDGVENRQIVN